MAFAQSLINAYVISVGLVQTVQIALNNKSARGYVLRLQDVFAMTKIQVAFAG